MFVIQFRIYRVNVFHATKKVKVFYHVLKVHRGSRSVDQFILNLCLDVSLYNLRLLRLKVLRREIAFHLVDR
jgi:hypothetical protein